MLGFGAIGELPLSSLPVDGGQYLSATGSGGVATGGSAVATSVIHFSPSVVGSGGVTTVSTATGSLIPYLRGSYGLYSSSVKQVTGVVVQAGDLIIVATHAYATNNEVTTLSDNAAGGSNTYTQSGTGGGSAATGSAHLFYAIAKASETLTIVANSASPSSFCVLAHVVANAAQSSPLISGAIGVDASSRSSHTSALYNNLTSQNAYIFNMFAENSYAAVFTDTSGFTQGTQLLSANPTSFGKVVTTASSSNAQTATTVGNYTAIYAGGSFSAGTYVLSLNTNVEKATNGGITSGGSALHGEGRVGSGGVTTVQVGSATPVLRTAVTNSVSAISVVAGDLIVVSYGCFGAVGSIACVDTAAGGSNSYTRCGTGVAGNGSQSAEIFYAIAKATENISISISSGSGSSEVINVHVVSNTDPSIGSVLSAFGFGPAEATVTTHQSATISTLSAHEYVVAFFYDAYTYGNVWSPTADGFSQTTQSGGLSYSAAMVKDSPGSVNSTATTGTATPYVLSTIASFKAASAYVGLGSEVGKVVSGGVTSGGTAPFSVGVSSINDVFTGVGGVTSGSSADFHADMAPAVAGGVATGGGALQSMSLVLQSIGGAALAGAALVTLALGLSGSGGLATGGALTKSVVTALNGGVTTGGSVVQAPAHIGTGGIVSGGVAVVTTSQPQNPVFTGTGGVATGSSAAYSAAYAPAISGGLATGGSPIVAPAHLGTGSVVSSGQAIVGHALIATGGVATGGQAVTSGAQNPVFVGAGGVVTSGTVAPSVALIATPTGGAASGGTAPFLHSGDFTGSGGLTTGSSAPFYFGSVRVASGGVATGGAADYTQTAAQNLSAVGSGGVATGGYGLYYAAVVVNSLGGVATGGAAPFVGQHYATPNGGVATGDSAQFSGQYVPGASGGVATGGSAPYYYSTAFIGSGGVATSGAAILVDTVILVVDPRYFAHSQFRVFHGVSAPRNFHATKVRVLEFTSKPRNFHGVSHA